jgi:hypothetical protein
MDFSIVLKVIKTEKHIEYFQKAKHIVALEL